MAKRVGLYIPGTPEWDDARRWRLGGSEISAVLGLSPFDSYFTLWWRKKGMVPPKPRTESMDWGNRLEPVVLQRFAEEHDGFRIQDVGSFVSDERSWQLASPDGMHEDGQQLVEAKTDHDWRPHNGEIGWGEAGTDEIPIYYRCQALWNLDVLGAHTCHIPVLNDGYRYREYVITRDERAERDIAKLVEAGAEFMTALINDKEPPLDGHTETLRMIREQHPDIDYREDVLIDAELREAYLLAITEHWSTSALRQEVTVRILAQMGNARNAVDELGRRFAFRVPNGEYPPYLRPDDALVRSMRPVKTIT
jgi:putative phage-type endonuclease